ncbi:MAG TPA: hypothetical protein DC006_00585 [Prevotellaceae bacterium]|nr:hypothetical protein [Prevotellaceae bacterium]
MMTMTTKTKMIMTKKMTKKRSVLMAIVLTLALTASAIPARHVQRTLTLADGTQVTATLCGDEHFHYWKTRDGRAFVAGGQGTVTEMSLSQARQKMAERVQASNARRRARASRRKSAWGAETNPVSGERKGLVILANFKDTALVHSRADYEDYFNKEGYSANGCTGSVRDYFLSQSYGKFSLDFDVMGPVTLSKDLSYYGQNDSGGNDSHVGEMVAEAVRLAVQGIDLKKYDWDGDGYVDQVYVVYAGYGEHAGAPDHSVWPHEYELSSAAYYGDGPGALTFNGVTIDTYACSCELRGSSGSTMDGIGTACHEFSHCLAIPDMYDTEGGNFGMDVWDLMDYGSYNGAGGYGETPAPFTSYERMYCGWLTPIELTSACTVSAMPALTDEPVAYLVRNDNPAYPGEYYLLENHQQRGWDAYAPASGLLVLHVDFDSNVWAKNTVNTVASQQRMTIIPADNKLSHYDTEGDTWPGTSRKTALTDTSIPAATLYHPNSKGRKYMGRPIEHIAEADGKISFTFDGGIPLPQLAAPVMLPVAQVTDGGFTARWQRVEGATSYEVLLTAKSTGSADIEESVLLDENFSKFNNGKSTDGTVDLAGKLDEYTLMAGWTGEKLYATPGDEVKMGSGKANGRLATPALSPSGHNLTAVVQARQYGSASCKLQMDYVDADGQTETLGEVDLEREEVYIVADLQGVESLCRLQVKSKKRAYVSRIVVLDGTFGDDELDELLKVPVKSMGRRLTRKAAATSTVTTSALNYTFTGLSSGRIYTCRVRALADGYAPSEWSEAVEVDFSTGIEGMPVMADGKGVPAVYDLQGRRVAKPGRGIYIKGGRKCLAR